MSTGTSSTNPIDLNHKSCKQHQLQDFEPAADTPTIISIANSKIKAHPPKNAPLANPILLSPWRTPTAIKESQSPNIASAHKEIK